MDLLGLLSIAVTLGTIIWGATSCKSTPAKECVACIWVVITLLLAFIFEVSPPDMFTVVLIIPMICMINKKAGGYTKLFIFSAIALVVLALIGYRIITSMEK